MADEGFFKFETRGCPRCGASFEALTFWDADVPCGDCNVARYRERLAQINTGRPYTVASIGGACPTQADGRTADDRPFYFRARHGQWTLEVGRHGWPTGLLEWPQDGECVAHGEEPSGGSMEDADVLALLDEHL